MSKMFAPDRRPNGPGKVICNLCGRTLSSNALAWAGHTRGREHQGNLDRESERRVAARLTKRLAERKENKP